MALYKSLLYKTIDNCDSLTNEEVIQYSQELDEVITEIYKEQLNTKKGSRET